jgi:hypothetical protein
MDPFSLIAGGVATGAAAALKSTATKAVKDAYTGLVTLIKDAYKAHSHVADSVEHLAKCPGDENRRTGLEKDLRAGAPERAPDHRLVEAADRVLKTIESDDPASARTIGVDIGALSAAALHFKRVQPPTGGISVRIKEAQIKGTASFEDIGGVMPPKE